MIDVLIVEPNKLPYEKQIPNTLEAKQEIVQGYIECINPIDDSDVCFICNDESKINGLEPNRDIGFDILFGTFIVIGDDYENSDFKSLNKTQIEKYKKVFDENSITKTINKINYIKSKNNIKDYEY